MNSEQFVYWLQGFIELNGEVPTEEQWESIKEHLSLCFNKVTKSINMRYHTHGRVEPDFTIRVGDLGDKYHPPVPAPPAIRLINEDLKLPSIIC